MSALYALQKSYKRFQFVLKALNDCDTTESLERLLMSQHYKNINECIDSNSGKTLLHMCNDKKTALLINSGININQKDSNGRTALFIAGDKKAKALITAGADITITDNEGDNAISFYQGTLSIKKIKKLVELGLDPNHKNNKGQNLMDRLMHERDYAFMNYDTMIELPKYGVFFGSSPRVEKVPEKVVEKMRKNLMEYERGQLVLASYEKNILEKDDLISEFNKKTIRL